MAFAYDFDRGNIAQQYDAGRYLPEDTLRQWLDELAPHVSEGVRVLDLGCGTGRFTAALAERFSANVCGCDRSEKMLAVARQSLAASPAVLVRGAAESLPFPGETFEVVLLSMVLHHFRPDEALPEIRRVLQNRGVAIVRTASLETMGSYLWRAFFPAAEQVEGTGVLSREAIARRVSNFGFTLEVHRVVEQVFARDLREYIDKISMRSLSTLAAISDDDFASGLSALERHCAAAPDSGPVTEQVDLFVFRK